MSLACYSSYFYLHMSTSPCSSTIQLVRTPSRLTGFSLYFNLVSVTAHKRLIALLYQNCVKSSVTKVDTFTIEKIKICLKVNKHDEQVIEIEIET